MSLLNLMFDILEETDRFLPQWEKWITFFYSLHKPTCFTHTHPRSKNDDDWTLRQRSRRFKVISHSHYKTVPAGLLYVLLPTTWTLSFFWNRLDFSDGCFLERKKENTAKIVNIGPWIIQARGNTEAQKHRARGGDAAWRSTLKPNFPLDCLTMISKAWSVGQMIALGMNSKSREMTSKHLVLWATIEATWNAASYGDERQEGTSSSSLLTKLCYKYTITSLPGVVLPSVYELNQCMILFSNTGWRCPLLTAMAPSLLQHERAAWAAALHAWVKQLSECTFSPLTMTLLSLPTKCIEVGTKKKIPTCSQDFFFQKSLRYLKRSDMPKRLSWWPQQRYKTCQQCFW